MSERVNLERLRDINVYKPEVRDREADAAATEICKLRAEIERLQSALRLLLLSYQDLMCPVDVAIAKNTLAEEADDE